MDSSNIIVAVEATKQKVRVIPVQPESIPVPLDNSGGEVMKVQQLVNTFGDAGSVSIMLLLSLICFGFALYYYFSGKDVARATLFTLFAIALQGLAR